MFAPLTEFIAGNTVIVVCVWNFTWLALQRHAASISQLVSRAALEAAVSCGADDAGCRTGLAPLPSRGEKPLRADFSALTVKEVS